MVSPVASRPDSRSGILKYDLALFQQLNHEYRDRKLVPSPRKHDSSAAAERGSRRASSLIRRFAPFYSVLEIGCGRGDVIRALVNQEPQLIGEGCDIVSYEEWERPCPTNLVFSQTDLAEGQLPTSTPMFDFIYSLAVFEHVQHPYSMLRAIKSIVAPGGKIYLEANLYRGPKASHRYREVFFPWPHLLFSDDIFEDYYRSIGREPKRPAWVNQLSVGDYLNYFNLLGLQIEKISFDTTPIDEEFYSRFEDRLSRIPRFDLERDFLKVELTI